MIFNFFSQTLDVYINRAGVSNVFISPDLIQKLLSGKYMVWGRRQKIQKLQLLWGHIHGFSHINYRIVGEIDGKIFVFHTFVTAVFRY